ncbi:hypothetical protein JHK87_027966 [Glycine soja]|nr:hypothetical protein JHK87_027966 [Glycine soja]
MGQSTCGAPSTSSLAFYVGSNEYNCSNKFKGFLGLENDDLVSIVVPTMTVVLVGHSIC